MRSIAISLVVAGLLLVGCGGGGGSSVRALTLGPVDWGVPFVPSGASSGMKFVARNLDNDATTISAQVFMPDGTPYSGPSMLSLDGNDEFVTGLSGTSGGWIRVNTPSRLVEISFELVDFSGARAESSRAWPLGDLAAPPASTTAGATITAETTGLQLVNASALATVVAVMGHAEPLDPTTTPAPILLAPIALAANESVLLDPALVAGFGFVGSLEFTSATPIFVATQEGSSGVSLGLAGVPPVVPLTRLLAAQVDFGLEHAFPVGYTDFALILRNRSDAQRTVTLNQIRRTDGTQIKVAPRTIDVSAHATRTVGTTDPLLSDLFGDATLASFLTTATIELTVPGDVEATFRQFDPVALTFLRTVTPCVQGHVFHVLDVEPELFVPSDTRTFFTVYNPGTNSITVSVAALIPQPEGFDAGLSPLPPLTVPSHTVITTSVDGQTFLDRDLNPVSSVGLRLTSPSLFHVFAWTEERNASDLLVMLTPRIVRAEDDAD